ncbi:AAEL012067-PA [Aedes aegypti]|uniref:AAEL012067-PA n=1 Tax=Aedes aegypti TaxID=7159 RepID=Q16N72_AEDAE|nr:AAEL012067-PA [Aedes aegypti]
MSRLIQVTALECYECFGVNECNGEQKDHTVQCEDTIAQAVFGQISSLFYPTLQDSLVRNGKFQCSSFRFTRQGEVNASILIRGCMFETREELCRIQASPANFGVLNCHACRSNRCNGSAAFGWNVLLVMASLVASLWMAK